jgi:regulator of sirC expression with transglutaminase-like and TPR domain
LPVSRPFPNSPEFDRLLRDDPEVDLTRIALEIARDAHPDLETESCLAHIDALADRVRDRCSPAANPRQHLAQINWVLYVEEGYRGNIEDYYDPRNSYLDDVIERRMGIPISLATLYRAVAERVGLRLSGVNLPAHFVLRSDTGAGTLFIDPFHDGILLDRDGCRRRVEAALGTPVILEDRQLDPCPTGVIVARMLRNLKAIYLRDHDYHAALPVVRRLAALVANDPTERRDHGLVCMQAGRPAEAIDPLASYVEDRPSAADAELVRTLLRSARRDVASWN